MDLLKPFKAVGKKVKEFIEDKEKETKETKRLEMWKSRLEKAMSEHEEFRDKAAEWDMLYNGTKEIVKRYTSYMSDRSGTSASQEARQVVNIVYQLIEGSIDLTVPEPQVDAIEDEDDMERRKMIEGMLRYMSIGPELQRIVSENERIAKKNSYCILKISYNPDYKSHKFRGRIETTNPHPANIIPQPGIHRIKDMDYIFHIENRTIDQICRTYGEEYRDKLDYEGGKYNYLDDFNQQSIDKDRTGKLSVIECWYKDKEGDVCLLTWCDEVILKDTPKFFYKRDEAGQPVYKELIEVTSIDPNTQMENTQAVEVECHVPKELPFIIWYNVPREKSFRGKSDVEIIQDQQEGIKKLLSIEEEKQLKGTTKIITRRGSGLMDKLTNAVSQILETDDPTADIKVVDLKTPDISLIELYKVYLQAAKDSIGITEASQGRAENTTLSGKALEALQQYTQDRMSIKQFEKNIAFTELYQMYYDFLLAFYDDKIPYRIDGKDDKPEFGYFDKSKLIKQDAAGEWYYPEFDIYINSNVGLPKDKKFIIDITNSAIEMQAIDQVDYWTIMDSIGFPNASFILERAKEKMEMAQQQQEAQMQMQQQQQAQQQQQQQQQMDMQNQQAQMQKQQQQAQMQMQQQDMAMKQQQAQQQIENQKIQSGLQQQKPLSKEEQAILQQIVSNFPENIAKKMLEAPPQQQRILINDFLKNNAGK